MAAVGTRLCPGCGLPRPTKSFLIRPRRGEAGATARGYVCALCRRGSARSSHKLSEPKATPGELAEAILQPARPAAEVLSEPRDFALLRLLDEGATLAQAEVAVGYERGGVSRKKLLGTEEFRLGMAYALIRRGVDRDRVAQTILECFSAERSRLNPATGELEQEPDHATRLRAADTAARLLDVVPRNHQAGGGATVVIIKTNLEEHAAEKPVDGAYVVEKRPLPREANAQ